MLQSPELFSSKNNTGFSFLLGQELDLIPLEIDPPEHRGYRSHFNVPLSPREVAKREDAIRASAVELIEAFRSEGHCDFVEQFAVHFPVRIFMDLFGMPSGRFQQDS